jgi:hypothetical protein
VEHSPALDERYREIVELLRQRQLSRVDIGRLLEQVNQEKLFGPHETFRGFVAYHLNGMSAQEAYRLIFAYHMRGRLMQSGAETLPSAESQVRPLHRLESIKPKEVAAKCEMLGICVTTVTALQIACWQRACRLKKKGHPPTAADVTREVNRILIKEPDFPIDEGIRTYRENIAKAQRFLTRANRLLDDGSLDSFFVLCAAGGPEGDNANARRGRIGSQLAKISNLIDKHCQNFGTLSYRQAGSLFGLKLEENQTLPAQMTDKELKLLALALNASASEGEIANSAVAFIQSLRKRGITFQDMGTDQ